MLTITMNDDDDDDDDLNKNMRKRKVHDLHLAYNLDTVRTSRRLGKVVSPTLEFLKESVERKTYEQCIDMFIGI